MSIATELKEFHKDVSELLAVAEEKAEETTYDCDNESAEFDFVDSSVLIVCGDYVSAYASR